MVTEINTSNIEKLNRYFESVGSTKEICLNYNKITNSSTFLSISIEFEGDIFKFNNVDKHEYSIN